MFISKEPKCAVGEKFSPLRKTYWPQMRTLINNTINESSLPASTLRAMSDYHLNTQGKRIRAILPLMVAELFEVDKKELLHFGAACEVLHGATLVHDDLQDGDHKRRGQDTIWKRFGIAQAINLGDAMFYYAALLAHTSAQRTGDRISSPSTFNGAPRKTNTTGTHGDPNIRPHSILDQFLRDTLRVIEGQELEFAFRQEHEPSLAGYFQLVEGKTAALFRLPLAGAARLCGADEPSIVALSTASKHLGVLFQIQDDILDLWGDKGRDDFGSDIAEGKRSILVVHALNYLPETEAQHLRTVLNAPRNDTSPLDIAEARTTFENCGSLAFACEEMERRRVLAVEAFADIEQPGLRWLVDGLADLFMAPIHTITCVHNADTAARSPNARSTAEMRFCEEILPRVSRTFALSIAQLPEPLRKAVLCAYLLCRIVDTIEDENEAEHTEGLRTTQRDALFDEFFRALNAEHDGTARAAFQKSCTDLRLAENSPDGELCRNAGAVLSVFDALPAAQQSIIRPRVLVMLEGMRSYCHRRAHTSTRHMNTIEDLEDYCYYVAGTVGRLLTDLFIAFIPQLPHETTTLLSGLAIDFGVGLQLVNILKDVSEDFERGVVFIPAIMAQNEGLSLHDLLSDNAEKHERGLRVIRKLCAKARAHLKSAKRYTLSWPAPQNVATAGLSEGGAIQKFCALPLALAIATLDEIENGEHTLCSGRTPKIDRQQVLNIMNTIDEALGNNATLSAALKV